MSLLFLGHFTNKTVDGKRRTKNNAGDLVSKAPPKANPASIAVSKRSLLAVMAAKISVQTPNIVNIAPARAILSKNTVKGEMA